MIKKRVLSLLIVCLLGVGTSFCAKVSDQKRIAEKKSLISSLEGQFNKLQEMLQHNLIKSRDNTILTQTRILSLIDDILKISPSERKHLKENFKKAQANLKIEIELKKNEIVAFANEIARLKSLSFAAAHKRDLELARKTNIDNINKKITTHKQVINTMKTFLY